MDELLEGDGDFAVVATLLDADGPGGPSDMDKMEGGEEVPIRRGRSGTVGLVRPCLRFCSFWILRELLARTTLNWTRMTLNQTCACKK